MFDHHDINPELFEAKFNRRGPFHKLLLALERLTFRTADVSISTNETFKEIAVDRGGMDPDRVVVVRSIPDLSRFQRTEPDAALRNGRRHLIGYVGIMGAQDGVDLLIEAMAALVHGGGRRDVQCAIVGSGTEMAKLQRLTKELALEDYVTFTGFRSGPELLSALSAFDIGVIPDPKNVYNDKISMNKHFEYMTLGIPFVQFRLTEGARIAGGASLYAEDNSPADLAANMARLIDDEALREQLAAEGRERARELLRWDRERSRLLAAYEMARPSASPCGRGHDLEACRMAS